MRDLHEMDMNDRWREKYYDKVEELNVSEVHNNAMAAEILKLRAALKDIMDHAKEPYLGPKWAFYIREVAEEALK